MANDEHVALLKKGVEAWNAWRDENPRIWADLSGADKAHLSWANLSGAKLLRADLSGAGRKSASQRFSPEALVKAL